MHLLSSLHMIWANDNHSAQFYSPTQLPHFCNRQVLELDFEQVTTQFLLLFISPGVDPPYFSATFIPVPWISGRFSQRMPVFRMGQLYQEHLFMFTRLQINVEPKKQGSPKGRSFLNDRTLFGSMFSCGKPDASARPAPANAPPRTARPAPPTPRPRRSRPGQRGPPQPAAEKNVRAMS